MAITLVRQAFAGINPFCLFFLEKSLFAGRVEMEGILNSGIDLEGIPPFELRY
jgi:hypothetical protein